MTIHGSTADSQRITQNGLTLGTIVGGGYGGGAVPNASAVQEWTFDYWGVSAEMATGGVRINFIPKEGGNSVSGVIFGSFTNSSLQGDNFSQDLKGRGLLYPNLMKRIWDFNPGIGGAIARDPAVVLRVGAEQRVVELRARHGLQPQRQHPGGVDLRP